MTTPAGPSARAEALLSEIKALVREKALDALSAEFGARVHQPGTRRESAKAAVRGLVDRFVSEVLDDIHAEAVARIVDGTETRVTAARWPAQPASVDEGDSDIAAIAVLRVLDGSRPIIVPEIARMTGLTVTRVLGQLRQLRRQRRAEIIADPGTGLMAWQKRPPIES